MKEVLDNFGALEEKLCEYKNSKAAILPIPYEATTTYLKGTANGPLAAIEASKNMELYDEELNKVIADIGISTLGELNASSKPEEMVIEVKNRCLEILNDNKFPVVIGGEHSISVGFLMALKQKYSDISILQLDAHADMRNEYEGSKYNHACIMARARELCSGMGVGIRSLCQEEAKVIKEKKYKTLWAKDKNDVNAWVNEILNSLKKDVYITIDADVFDPSIMPSVGTPEPGGLSWEEVLAITKAVFKNKNVVGFDVVELCPNDTNKAPDFLIAKLIYKLIGYKFFNN